MAIDRKRIAVMAPASRLGDGIAARVVEIAESLWPEAPPELMFHPQCFQSEGHFAGSDAARADAFVQVANDPAFDAVWFARGGYGSGRILDSALPRLGPVARAKTYLGYSDEGALLAALYAAGIGRAAHGPMPQDLVRANGEAAVTRALRWLVEADPTAVEPSLVAGTKTVAFNLTILASLIGTPWLPDLSGHVLMLEDVSEPMYRIDRLMFQLTSTPALRAVAGIRLGRFSDIPPNEPDFGRDEVEVVQAWCARSGIAWLGRADIGHDADNKVVPFGQIG